MNILVTGADGYVGWPFFISLAKKYFSKKVKIIGLDNLQRRSLVKKIRSNSAIKIATFSQRQKFINNLNKNVFLLKQDVANFDNVNKFIKKYKFKYIFNLAAQPSAPYSFLGANETNFTQNNNNQILRNIIWSLKENKLSKKCKLIHTTTTGVYGFPKIKIPEGFLKKGREKFPFGFMAGSWYHMGKCNDVNNLYLSDRVYGTKYHDFRTAIVIGLDYDAYDINDKINYNTRFDYDFYFGVVVNRFIAMALKNKNLTIYGRGLQRKPFISLNDCVRSLINFLDQKESKISMVYNQYTHMVGIKKIAKLVLKSPLISKNANLKNIKNPRVENETHQMRMENRNFIKVLKTKPESLKKTIIKTIELLKKNDAKFKFKFDK
jgi:nucleoside-diphosphate-sugar epimerase